MNHSRLTQADLQNHFRGAEFHDFGLSTLDFGLDCSMHAAAMTGPASGPSARLINTNYILAIAPHFFFFDKSWNSPFASCYNLSMKFVHLHTHSHYSLLDGLPKIEELVLKAKRLGMESLALTDHGFLYGAIDFYKTAKQHGIKPIIG